YSQVCADAVAPHRARTQISVRKPAILGIAALRASEARIGVELRPKKADADPCHRFRFADRWPVKNRVAASIYRLSLCCRSQVKRRDARHSLDSCSSWRSPTQVFASSASALRAASTSPRVLYSSASP